MDSIYLVIVDDLHNKCIILKCNNYLYDIMLILIRIMIIIKNNL